MTTASPKVGFLLLILLLGNQMYFSCGQFGGLDINSILGSMGRIDKIKLLAGILAGKPDLYDQLEAAAVAALPILGYDTPPNILTNIMLPWALDHLPNLLKNPVLLKYLEIFITEIDDQNKHNYTRLISGINSNDTRVIRDTFVARLLPELVFPYNSADRAVSEECFSNTMAFVDRLLAGDDWAINMFDAIGKPTTGINKGVMYFIGTYDECVAIKANIPVNTSLGEYRTDKEMQFGGRYCRATVTPPRSLLEAVAGEHINQTYGIPLRLSLGLCVPDTCSSEDLEGLLNLGILGTLLNLTLDDAVCDKDLDFEGDQESHIIVGLLGGLLVLAIVSSLVDLLFLRPNSGSLKSSSASYTMDNISHSATNNAYDDILDKVTAGTETTEMDVKSKSKPTQNGHLQENGNQWKGVGVNDIRLNTTVDSDLTDVLLQEQSEDQSIWKKLLRSFSIFLNIGAAVRTDTKSDDIACLYGVRFFSMTWILLGNTYIYVALSLVEVPVAVNLMDTFDILKRFTFEAVLGATFATDTFFMISGCLISYWFLARSAKDGKMTVTSWLKFYAGKLWKMTPPYMLVLVTYVYLYNYLGNGPMWPQTLEVADRCRTDWWKHLLYINNLFNQDGVTAERQCMTWSWHLAVTMQFYLISPVLLSFLAFSSSMGLLLIVILAAAGMIAAGVREAEFGGDIMSTRDDGGAYWNNVFIKPWCRVSTYCVGLILGFILQKLDHKKPHKIFALLGWVVASCVGVLVVYCQYTKYADGLEPWTKNQMAAFESLGRPAWAACVAWVVYACCMGFAGPLRDFLSWKGFVPLSRLTYMVYLLNPVLMVLVVYTRRSLVYLDDFDMAYLFVGHITMNYVAAFFAMLLFDLPFRNLRRIVSGKPFSRAY